MHKLEVPVLRPVTEAWPLSALGYLQKKIHYGYSLVLQVNDLHCPGVAALAVAPTMPQACAGQHP